MPRTHVILDGLQDPLLGQQLSRHWANAGFDNAVDVAGQSAWVGKGSNKATERRSDEGGGERHGLEETPSPETRDPNADLSETDVDRAASIARAFGLELRDRVGQTFVAANSLDALRGRMAYEYKSRFATALVFGLPALALHYGGNFLAGEPNEPRDMLFPWGIQFLLVGWACIAAGWPILWQGLLSLTSLRTTSDLLTTLTLIAAVIPSAVGIAVMIFRFEPFYGLAGPTFHAATYLLFLALLQRWLVYRHIEALAGKAMLMLPRCGRLVAVWMALVAAVMFTAGWRAGLAVAMLLPTVASLAAINPWNPGWASLFPTFAFTLLVLIDPAVDQFTLEGVRIEVAASFGLIQTLVMMMGWRRMKPQE